MRTDVLAVYFRELRKGYSYTQQSFAAAAGVGKRTIERLEREEGPISRNSLERIIAAVGASPDEVNYLSTSASATEIEASELAQALLRRSLNWRDIAGRSHLPYQDPRLLGVQTYVRKLRERRNISRKALADLLGISIAVLANWEDGRSSGLAFPVVVRAVKHLGGTLEDLEQIGAAPINHEVLGDQLAKARATSADDESSPRQKNTSDAHANGSHERTILQRIAAIEGLLQFISDDQPNMKRARSAIVIHPPEHDGDRDKLIAALAAAVVAIARERAGCASDPPLDAPATYGSPVKSA